VRKALQAISSRLGGSGPEVNAYSLRDKTAKERARIAFAQMREAEVPAERMRMSQRAVGCGRTTLTNAGPTTQKC
jgi:hypothetical protein